MSSDLGLDPSSFDEFRKDLIQAVLKCCADFTNQRKVNGRMPIMNSSKTESPVKYNHGSPDELPYLYLDDVQIWNSSECFYIIGLNAWLMVKPFVSFFCHEFEMKVGSAVPCILESPSCRQRLLWHAVAGTSHVDYVRCVRRSQKVWLKLPADSHGLFEKLVSSLGMQMLKRMCCVFCGRGMLMSSTIEEGNHHSLLLHGIESNGTAASIFGYLPGVDGMNVSQWHQYISPTVVFAEESCLPAEAAPISCDLGTGRLDRIDDSVDAMIEVKDEFDCGSDALKDESLSCEVVRGAPSPALKCPGCSVTYHANKCGCAALSHHIMGSHKKHAGLYQRIIRMRLAKLYGRRKCGGGGLPCQT